MPPNWSAPEIPDTPRNACSSNYRVLPITDQQDLRPNPEGMWGSATWSRRTSHDRTSISLRISYPWRGRSSSGEGVRNSVLPFLSSRSSMDVCVLCRMSVYQGDADAAERIGRDVRNSRKKMGGAADLFGIEFCLQPTFHHVVIGDQ